jgi:single-strand DNA-binding protein
MNLNSVILAGNLTGDPAPGAARHALSTFTLAFDAPFGFDRGGAARRRDFVPVVAFGHVADTCIRHLKKGSRVIVEGRLREDRWQSLATGQHSRLTLVCDRIHFVSGLRKETGAPPPEPQGNPAAGAPPSTNTAPACPTPQARS